MAGKRGKENSDCSNFADITTRAGACRYARPSQRAKGSRREVLDCAQGCMGGPSTMHGNDYRRSHVHGLSIASLCSLDQVPNIILPYRIESSWQIFESLQYMLPPWPYSATKSCGLPFNPTRKPQLPMCLRPLCCS